MVYRGGDAVSGWVFAGLRGAGLGISAISFVAATIAAVWLVTGWGWERSKRPCGPSMWRAHTGSSFADVTSTWDFDHI